MGEKFPAGSASSLRGHKIIAAYWRFLQALEARPDPKAVSDDPEVERTIWEAVESVFRAHGSCLGSDPALPFPHEISWFVADAISELLAGGEPDSWKIIRHTGNRSGAPKRARPEYDQIHSAVVYIKAVRQGLIDDNAPSKTVCEVFGVAKSTVRDWCAKCDMKHINPTRLAASNPNLCDTLRAMMLEHGRFYREARRTRSQAAISRRGPSRKG